MTNNPRPNPRCSDLQVYEIRLQGHLDDRWGGSLEGLAFTREADGTTTLTGQLVDQAALHGVLSRLRDLGLPIVSIRRICPNNKEGNS